MMYTFMLLFPYVLRSILNIFACFIFKTLSNPVIARLSAFLTPKQNGEPTESHIVDTPLPRYPKKIVTEKDNQHDPKRRIIPDTSWLAEFASTPGYHILLSHHPEFVDEIKGSVVKCGANTAGHIDLILSGHAHGGQWRVYHPIKKKWIGVFAPGQGLWPKLTEGVHEIYKSTLIISRGLTNTSKIPRFFNRPEVVYISGVGKNCDSKNIRSSMNIRGFENKPAENK